MSNQCLQLLHIVFTMFIYVFRSVTYAHTIKRYIAHVFMLFTLYNIHNNCTKGSQSRERNIALLGSQLKSNALNDCDMAAILTNHYFLTDIMVNEDIIIEAIHKLSPNSAAGLDWVPTSLLVNCATLCYY